MASGIDLDQLKSNYQKVQSWTNTLPGQTRMSYSEIKQTPVNVGTVKYSPVTYNGTEYKTQDAGALKQALAKQLRPTYDMQASAARKNTSAQNAAIDADAASRGMGTSTWVTDVKNRNYNTLNDNLRAIEADYANTLYGNLLSRLSEQEARKLQNDQYNASNQLNTDLSNAQGQYNADATNVSNKYTADVFNSTAAYQAALQNWQNQQAALQYNNELDQAALARNLELAQLLKTGGSGKGNPKPKEDTKGDLVPYMDETTGQYKFGYAQGDGTYVWESDPDVIRANYGNISLKNGRGVYETGQYVFPDNPDPEQDYKAPKVTAKKQEPVRGKTIKPID